MSIHIIHLTGCTPTPLANYLKALGILRLVSEQKDPNARLWWENEHAVLASFLSREELLQFFADEYKPTPIIAPWNGGSGFYKKDNQEAINKILQSQSERFENYRNTISMAQNILGDAENQPKDKQKTDLILKLKKHLRDCAAEWLSAVAILTDNEKPNYPAILGTGGNDGRLDFTNNFMQRLTELLEISKSDCHATSNARQLLDLALYNLEVTTGLTESPIGFFSPAAVGGKANASNTFDCGSRVNPWDYILMLEGAILFATGVVRRCNTEQLPSGSAPFAIFGQGIGYGGAVNSENSRGEQWVPIWNKPSSLREVSDIFEQGRVQLGDKTAVHPAEIARAIGRLGTARGISAFERYGYLERNGQAYLAISLGRWNVAAQAHQEVIDHAAEWLDNMAVYINSDNASNKLKSLYSSTNEALMAILKNASPARWETLLIAMGELECALGAHVSAKMPDRPPMPLKNLPPEWITLLPNYKNSPELRLALSLANVCGTSKHDNSVELERYNTLRGYFLPFEWNADKKSWQSYTFGKASPEYVAHSGQFIQDATNILRRRILKMQNGTFPIACAHGCSATLNDIAAFLNASLNDDKIWALAKPLMAISDWNAIENDKLKGANTEQTSLPAIYSLIRLAFPTDLLKQKKEQSFTVKADASILNLLLANNIRAAGQTAIRRLTSSGLKPYLQTIVANQSLAQRVAASLLFPIDSYALGRLISQLCRPTDETDNS